jgi:hypothetical protein
MSADEIIFCGTCDESHGRYDCPADPFGAPETITVGMLRVSDFVITIPAQAGTRGARANSGIREISPEHFDKWFTRTRPRGPRFPVGSRKIVFHDRELGALDVPSTHTVLVRRLAEVASA